MMLLDALRSSAPVLARRLPIFYGWLIVALAVLAGLLAAGVNNVAVSVVFKPLTEDLGWSRSLAAGAVAAGTLGGVLAPFIGRLADRIGPRVLLPLGAALVGGLALAIGRVTEPWQFYAAYVPARAFAQCMLFGPVPLTAVTNWFHLKRPRAIGLVLMSVPLGSALLALLYQVIITQFGWRYAFLVLAPLLCLVVFPGALLLRRQPEDLGLLPDGVVAPSATDNRASSRPRRRPVAEETSWTLAAALRTRALWLVLASDTLSVVSTGAIGFHLVAYYTDVGLDPLLAASALSVFAFAGALANGVWGLLSERVPPRALYVASLLLAAAGMALLIQVRTPLLAFAFALLFGLSARGQDSLVQILVAQYFGRRSFGSISGFITAFSRGGLGVGPLIAAAAFDLTGGYGGVFTLFVGAYLLSACLIFTLRRPTPRALGEGIPIGTGSG